MVSSLIPFAAQVGPVPTGAEIFLSEFLGTAILLLLGGGVCAVNNLAGSKGKATGWVLITFGWGFAVYMGVYAAWKTGGHLNPAVTVAKWVAHGFNKEVVLNAPGELVGPVPVTVGNVAIYIVAQLAGAFVGAVVMYLAFKKQFDLPEDPIAKFSCFSTRPEVSSPLWNTVTEAIATMVLIVFVLVAGGTPSQVGPLAVAFIVVSIGMSLGGPTGYAINPARDLGPRIAHAVLPINDKGSSEWHYAWVPIVGPTIGAVVAVFIAYGLNMAV